MSQRIAGIKFNGFAVSSFGGVPLPVQPELERAQRGLDLGQVRLGLEGARGGLASTRPEKLWWRVSVDGTGAVTVGEAGPGESIILVQISGVDKKFDRFPGRRRTELLPEVTPMQVEIEGFRVQRLPTIKSAEPLRRQGQPHLFGDGRAQLAL